MRALALLLLLLLSLPAWAEPPSDMVSADRRLKELEGQLQQSRTEHDEAKKKSRELTDEMARIRTDMVAAARAAQESEEVLSELESQLADLKVSEAEKSDALKRRSSQMTRVLTALQRLAWRPTEALIAQPQSPADTVRSAILLRAAVPQIEQSVRDLRGEIELLSHLREDIDRQRRKIVATTAKLEEEHGRLKDLYDRKAEVQTDAEAERAAAEQRIESLAGEAEDLRDLMTRLEQDRQRRLAEAAAKANAERAARDAELAARRAAVDAERLAQKAARDAEVAQRRAEKERADREAAELRAQAQAEKAAQKAARESEIKAQQEARLKAQREAREKEEAAQARAEAAHQADLAAQTAAREKEIAAQQATKQAEQATREANAVRPVAAERPFSAAQGRMPFPARGKVVMQFGQTNDVGHVMKGIDIQTRQSAQVIAPYDGQVAFAGPFRGYGLLLIIEHGEGYHTLLAGMARIDATVGQRLLAGEPVGVMGQDDTKPTLYVELRRNGQPVNPLPWLTAQKSKVRG